MNAVEAIAGSADACEEFWQHMEAQGQLVPPAARHTWRDIVPLGLHGDDCRFTQAGEKLLAVSLNFPLGPLRGRYPLFLIRVVTSAILISMLINIASAYSLVYV